MKSVFFENDIYGNYITYDVNDVFEAVYILKHPKKVAQMQRCLANDNIAKKYINIYKETFRQYNDLNDLFLKYKIQFIPDLTDSKGVNLYPRFSYITYRNGKWMPIIFDDGPCSRNGIRPRLHVETRKEGTSKGGDEVEERRTDGEVSPPTMSHSESPQTFKETTDPSPVLLTSKKLTKSYSKEKVDMLLKKRMIKSLSETDPRLLYKLWFFCQD